MRFHILGLAHTISTPEYLTCAFTQKIVKLCALLTRRGHHVIHYGHQDSEVECAEHVTVVKRYDMQKSYGDWDWRRNGWVSYNTQTDWAYKVFNTRTPLEIEVRKEPGDFLLCSFPHKPIVDAVPDIIACEPGIGYPGGTFTNYRAFESYAIMHAYQGTNAVAWASNDFWYDAVIPNYFDLADFEFQVKKENYFLFIGRVNEGKGIHIAEQIAAAAGTELVVAGAGNFAFKPESDISHVGVADRGQRKMLLAGAKAVLCPSTFLEPFCGVQIEAMLSGTPVISSDRGAFAEYNKHGATGYRCKTFEQFAWAARNIDKIKPAACRMWAERFSSDNVGPMFDEYFASVQDVFGGGAGWYAERPDRQSLDFTSNRG